MTRAIAALAITLALSACAEPTTCKKFQLGLGCDTPVELDLTKIDAPEAEERNPLLEMLFGSAFAVALGHVLNAMMQR